MVKKTERKHSPGFFGRLLRSLISITILTTLVLGIAFTVKQLSTLDSHKIVSLSSPLLVKLGLNEEQVGEVSGALIERAGEVANKFSNTDETPIIETSDSIALAYKVAIMSDAENDTASLSTALQLAKENRVKAVFYLGDFTSWGDAASLKTMKEILDQSGLIYYAIPGDHDLAASVKEGDASGLANFKEIYGDIFHTVTLDDQKFIIMNNAANYTAGSTNQMNLFKSAISTANFVLFSQPLYHPTIPIYMGIVNGVEVPEVKEQGQELLTLIRQSNVQAIFAGDQHSFSKNEDPEKSTLTHFVTGALVSNDQELRNPQKPRFTLLEIYEDNSYKVKEVVL